MSNRLPLTNMRLPFLCLAVVLAASLACSSLTLDTEPTPLPTPTHEPATAVGPMPTEDIEITPTDDSIGGWTSFEDDTFGLSFSYPADWNGPEVNRYDSGIGVEVGSDTVYPFGTGLEDRNYTVPDAYFISVSYTQNTQGWDWDELIQNSPWMETYTELLELEDGEAITTPRSLTTRVGEVQVGSFSGLEYTSTLSETAQTEIFYAREVLLFDQDLNYIRVSGGPNNVQIGSDEDWRAAYQRVDAEHNEIFDRLVDSLSVAESAAG